MAAVRQRDRALFADAQQYRELHYRPLEVLNLLAAKYAVSKQEVAYIVAAERRKLQTQIDRLDWPMKRSA